MNESNFREEMYKCADILYLGEMSSSLKEHLDEELNAVENENLYGFWTAIHALASKLDKFERPVFYSGYMVDSELAYLFGLTVFDLEESAYRGKEDREARLYVDHEMMEVLRDYAECLYGSIVTVREIEDLPNFVAEGLELTIEGIDVPIYLYVVPYCEVLYSLSSRLRIYNFSFDEEKVLSLLAKEYCISDEDVIGGLIEAGISDMPEIVSSRTKVALLYELNFFKVFYPREYYKTLLAVCLNKFSEVAEVEDALKNGKYDQDDYLSKAAARLFEDGFLLTHIDCAPVKIGDIETCRQALVLSKDGEEDEISPLIG